MTNEEKLYLDFKKITASFKVNIFQDEKGTRGGPNMNFEIHPVDSRIKQSMVFESLDICFRVVSKDMIDRDKDRFKQFLKEKIKGLKSFRIAFIEK